MAASVNMHEQQQYNIRKPYNPDENPIVKPDNDELSTACGLDKEPSPSTPHHHGDTNSLTWEWATSLKIAGLSRVEAYNQFYRPVGGNFADWMRVYPELKKQQRMAAKMEVWVLDSALNEFKIVEDEKERDVAQPLPTVELKDAGDDVFWYFWDYDTGMKKRMTGIAARQIECGYQWIKKSNYEVNAALRSGVNATRGIYQQLSTKYKLSYQVTPAAQKDKQHIAVYQINVHTGFQRLLERYPPETTAAKIRAGSFMDVYLLRKETKDSSTIIDFWIKGGRTHFQQVWIPSVIRFVIDTPVTQNRIAQEKDILDLWRDKKLVGVGHNANVEIKQDARHMKQFVLSLNKGEEKIGEMRDARSSKIAIYNYMDALWREKNVSIEVALSSTKEHFGPHFFNVFASEAKFRDQFLRQYNEQCVLWYTHIPFDLIDVMDRAEKLFTDVGPDEQTFSVSYIFETVNKKATTFAAVDCDPISELPRAFNNTLFIDQQQVEVNEQFGSKVEKYRRDILQRTRMYTTSGIGDILVEDAIFDTAIKMTREAEHRLILTVFPFDREHLYVFRNGAVARVEKDNVRKFLSRIAHIEEGKIINDLKILSVETFADGSVQYGCQNVKDTEPGQTLTRKHLHEIMPFGDEKELEGSVIEPEAQPATEVDEKLEEKEREKDNAVWRAIESLEHKIERMGEALKSFFPIDEETKGRRSDGHVIREFIAHAVDDRNVVFPTVAVFHELPSTSRDEIKKLYSVANWEIDMARVFACAISVYNESAVLGIVETEDMAHFFKIDVGGKVDDIGLVSERLASLRLAPQGILAKSNRKIRFMSHVAGEELEYNVRDQNVAEQLSVKFAECQVLHDVFQDEPLKKIESCSKELREWSNGRRRVGRVGKFAVYIAQSTSFEYLRARLKHTKQGMRNPEYDPHMELLSNWDIAKWKHFTDNGEIQVHPDDVFVMIVDHSVYTFRRIRCPDKRMLQKEIETAYGIDTVSAENSFVYHDSDEVNIREECTSRGLYVNMPMCALPELTCPVCYEAKDSLSTLSCGHSFCHQCIRQQLYANNNNCAICRHDIMRPYMIPRPDQVIRTFVQKHYGPGYHRAMQYRSFVDDVEWNTIYAPRGEQRNDGGESAAVAARA